MDGAVLVIGLGPLLQAIPRSLNGLQLLRHGQHSELGILVLECYIVESFDKAPTLESQASCAFDDSED